MYNNIILTLKNLSGNHKNYTFNKYCTAHVEQHNQLFALAEYNVQDLGEAMKIHYFEEEIKNSSFDSGKTTIFVDRQKFQDFGPVMPLHINFKRLQKNDIPSQGHNVSALTQGRGGGGQGRVEDSKSVLLWSPVPLWYHYKLPP
jgi:hypothetical protein